MNREKPTSKSNEEQRGLPNWKNAEEYPKADELSSTEWRWEFLRRDAGYIKEWENYRLNKHPFSLALVGDSNDAGFDIPYYPPEYEDRWTDIWRLLRKYGLARLLDPSIASPQHLRFYFVPFAPDPKDNPVLRNIKIKEELIPWKLRLPYLAWFDIWKPIGPQLEFYAELLNREQSIALDLLTQRADDTKGGKKKKGYIQSEIEKTIAFIEAGSKLPISIQHTSRAKRDKRPKKEQYSRWLRVLDAKAHRASWGIIGKTLFADSYDPSIKARNAHLAATSLWWKIPVERSLGPVMGMEEARWQDFHSAFPPFESKDPILHNWLNLLPPQLSRIVVSSLS